MHEIPAFPEISWGKQHAARKQCLIFARNFIITFLASDTEMCTLPSVTGPLPRCYYQAGGAGVSCSHRLLMQRLLGGSRCVWHSDANNWEITGCLWRLMGLGAGMPCSRLGFIGQLKVEAGCTHLYKQRLCSGPSQAGHEKALPPHQEGWEERVLRFLGISRLTAATAWMRGEAKGTQGKQSSHYCPPCPQRQWGGKAEADLAF